MVNKEDVIFTRFHCWENATLGNDESVDTVVIYSDSPVTKEDVYEYLDREFIYPIPSYSHSHDCCEYGFLSSHDCCGCWFLSSHSLYGKDESWVLVRNWSRNV